MLISNAIASALQPSIYDSIILLKQLSYLPDLKPNKSVIPCPSLHTLVIFRNPLSTLTYSSICSPLHTLVYFGNLLYTLAYSSIFCISSVCLLYCSKLL